GGGNGTVSGGNATMEFIASQLSRSMGGPVLDRTGLSGPFDFTLEHGFEPGEHDLVTIAERTVHALGLKLEGSRWLVDTIIIEQLEKRSPNGQQDATADTVKILSISPPTDSPLRIGDSAKFEVEIEYNLNSANSGSVTLVIQQAESDRTPLANEVDVISKGKGRLVLSKVLLIPETKAIGVFTRLYVQGGTSTSVVDTRTYRVLK